VAAPESAESLKFARSNQFWVDADCPISIMLIHDSQANQRCAPEAGRATCRSPRVAAWHAVGAHDAAHRRLPETRAPRGPPCFLLTLSYPGQRSRQISVGSDRVAEVRCWLANYQELKASIEAIYETQS
jgi:hypothetical protein